MSKKMVSISQKELVKLQNKVASQEKKAKKKLERNIDGLSDHLKAKIRIALRQIWQRSKARKLCIDRVSIGDGYYRCEGGACVGKVHPKVYVDHIIRVGEVDEGFINRMFVSSDNLMALCKKCHDKKTKEERKC